MGEFWCQAFCEKKMKKVLTKVYLPMGATLMEGVLNAVFGSLKSLDMSGNFGGGIPIM